MAAVTDNQDDGPVTVATLVRGKTYTYHDFDPDADGGKGESKGYHHFLRGVPTPITEDLADKLEDLTEDVPDGDGDVITKDMFLIQRDAPVRSIAPLKRRLRHRIVSEEVDEKPILRVPARKPLTGGRKPGGFKRAANS